MLRNVSTPSPSLAPLSRALSFRWPECTMNNQSKQPLHFRGKDLLLPDMSVEHNTLQSGTTFSAAIVVRAFYLRRICNCPKSADTPVESFIQAGQAACMLSDPTLKEKVQWSHDDPQGNTVANRIKRHLAEDGKGSFQRVRREQMLDPTSAWEQVNIDPW